MQPSTFATIAFGTTAFGASKLFTLSTFGMVFRRVPEDFQRETGTVPGLVGVAGGLGGFFSPLVLKLIRGQTNTYTLDFIFLAGFGLLCLAVNRLVLARQGREREAV